MLYRKLETKVQCTQFISVSVLQVLTRCSAPCQYQAPPRQPPCLSWFPVYLYIDKRLGFRTLMQRQLAGFIVLEIRVDEEMNIKDKFQNLFWGIALLCCLLELLINASHDCNFGQFTVFSVCSSLIRNSGYRMSLVSIRFYVISEFHAFSPSLLTMVIMIWPHSDVCRCQKWKGHNNPTLNMMTSLSSSDRLKEASPESSRNKKKTYSYFKKISQCFN